MSSYQSNESTCRFLMVELARCYKGAGEMPTDSIIVYDDLILFKGHILHEATASVFNLMQV
jgi:hypothetical protein